MFIYNDKDISGEQTLMFIYNDKDISGEQTLIVYI